jgi:hypothetical protein
VIAEFDPQLPQVIIGKHGIGEDIVSGDPAASAP